MGTSLNVAFLQTDDLPRVRRELQTLVLARGRALVEPGPRVPEPSDPMQYGAGAEVRRWAIAAFPGLPGWTVLRTAPFELLLQGEAPLLPALCVRLGAPGFQYNMYDGDADFLFEVDREGHVEKSGFVGSDPGRYWDGGPPEDRFQVRFHAIAVDDAARRAEDMAPDLRVGGIVLPPLKRKSAPPGLVEAFARRRAALLAWVAAHAEVREEEGMKTWRAHPAHVVRGVARQGGGFLSTEGVIDRAIAEVFGGANSAHCDNLFLVETLVPHAPMPVEGFVLYADAPDADA